jgi:hypothetical protein
MSVLNALSRVARGWLGKRAASKAAAQEVAGRAGPQAMRAMASDVLITTDRAAVKAVANPAFEGAMDAVRNQVAKNGKYTNVAGPLMTALGFASNTDEALTLATLARKLSVGFNRENRVALKAALETAAEKAKLPEEAFQTLVQTVMTRQQAYALFSVADKNKLVETVVDRYMRVGGAEATELATRAVGLVPARFDQRTAKDTIRAVGLKKTIEEQITTIANFLNKALN